LQLGKHKDALEFAIAAQDLAPSNSEVAERVENVKKDLAAGLYLCYAFYIYYCANWCLPFIKMQFIPAPS
jgi:hypothetical protein